MEIPVDGRERTILSLSKPFRRNARSVRDLHFDEGLRTSFKDSVARSPVCSKLFGVFECAYIRSTIDGRCPVTLQAPAFSMGSGIPENALTGCGYSMLTWRLMQAMIHSLNNARACLYFFRTI